MDQTQNSSHRTMIVGVTVVVIIVIAAIITFVVLGNTKKTTTTTAKNTKATSTSTASKTNVQQDLANVDATIKQAASDQAAAKQAVTAGTNQVKVAN